VLQQTVSLYAKVFNLFLHSLKSMLCTSDGKLIVNYFLDEIFLKDTFEFFSRI
jgi:hypothetical protein